MSDTATADAAISAPVHPPPDPQPAAAAAAEPSASASNGVVEASVSHSSPALVAVKHATEADGTAPMEDASAADATEDGATAAPAAAPASDSDQHQTQTQPAATVAPTTGSASPALPAARAPTPTVKSEPLPSPAAATANAPMEDGPAHEAGTEVAAGGSRPSHEAAALQANTSSPSTPALAPASIPDVKLEDAARTARASTPTAASATAASASPSSLPSAAPASSVPPPSTLSRAMSKSVAVKNATDDVTQCPCGDNDDQEGFMIQCESCEIWQHGACIGLSEKTVPDQYYCERCDQDNPIHVAFRKKWGDSLPVKERKPTKSKAKKDKSSKDAAAAAGAADKKAGADHGDRRRAERLATQQAEAATAAANAAAQAALVQPNHKRKRTAEESTPKPPRSSKKVTEPAHAQQEAHAETDITKRARVDEHAQQHGAQQHAASYNNQLPTSTPTPAPRASSYSAAAAAAAAAEAESARARAGASDPHAPSTPHIGSSAVSAAEQQALLEAEADAAGGDMTAQDSREARKIQRYIRMIQKMEEESRVPAGGAVGGVAAPGAGLKAPDGSPASGGDLEFTAEEDAEMAAAEAQLELEGKDAHGQPLAQLPMSLNNVYSAATAARMARAKLRAEKLTRAESHHADAPGAAGTEHEQQADAPRERALTANEKKSLRAKERKRKEAEETPALTPAEIRTLRLTASSQLRPLGPMYFGKKQYLLQSYRDESLRCETGWSTPIHQELPMRKRIVSNYRTQQAEQQAAAHRPLRHTHVHDPQHPPSIFPASHPWSIQHPKKSKSTKLVQAEAEAEAAAHAAEVAAEAEPTAAHADSQQEPQAQKMEMEDDHAAHAHMNGAAAASSPVAASSAPSAGGASANGVKLEDASYSDLPKFLASIDTGVLPTRVQALIAAFSKPGAKAQALSLTAALGYALPNELQELANEPSPPPATAFATENVEAATADPAVATAAEEGAAVDADADVAPMDEDDDPAAASAAAAAAVDSAPASAVSAPFPVLPQAPDLPPAPVSRPLDDDTFPAADAAEADAEGADDDEAEADADADADRDDGAAAEADDADAAADDKGDGQEDDADDADADAEEADAADATDAPMDAEAEADDTDDDAAAATGDETGAPNDDEAEDDPAAADVGEEQS